MYGKTYGNDILTSSKEYEKYIRNIQSYLNDKRNVSVLIEGLGQALFLFQNI